MIHTKWFVLQPDMRWQLHFWVKVDAERKRKGIRKNDFERLKVIVKEQYGVLKRNKDRIKRV